MKYWECLLMVMLATALMVVLAAVLSVVASSPRLFAIVCAAAFFAFLAFILWLCVNM